jgi:glycosyltransferase involved in cell wall biosynthesis
VSEVKGVASLIDAFAALAKRMPGARLVVAGPLEGGEAGRWRQYIAERAPGLNVELPGEVSAERYGSLLREADVAVQLRLISNGEASAATADCLSAGLPTIVTDLGWASELPDNAVGKLRPEASSAELADQLFDLCQDEERRAQIGRAALSHARSCAFDVVARAYLNVLGLD